MNISISTGKDEILHGAAYSIKRDFFNSGKTRDYSFRFIQLKILKETIKSMEEDILSALYQDLKKPAMEAFTGEIALIYDEIDFSLKRLKKWMRPEKVKSALFHFPSVSKIYAEPLGIVLIIGPWNYPFQLMLTPLIGAIAAGNCALLKPPEETPATSKIIEELISKAFPKDYISVIQGVGHQVIPCLMDEYRFDHVFFTGSVSIGKLIGVAAAEKHIPCTLELGGKSPVIVDKDVDLKVTVRRIIWGKFFNGGQTCVAPDYLLLHEDIKEEFLKTASIVMKEFYGKLPLKSPDIPRIINEKRFDVLVSYLEQGDILIGGSYDRETLMIEPTIIGNINLDSPIMKEEIFGPILPIISYNEFEEAERIISENPLPLAAYIYTKNKKIETMFVQNIQFGGGCINNSIIQFTNAELPFGGIGYSGTGRYHGEYSFKTFSHFKSLVKSSMAIDLKMKYPPYKKSGLSFIRKFY